MSTTANKENLMKWLDLDADSVEILAKRIKKAGGDPDQVDEILDMANEMMGAHGVEAIRGDYHVDNYYFDVVALFVNTGDAYNDTLLYVTESERFLVITWRDWVERNQRKYNIQ